MSALLNPEQIAAACRTAEVAGADLVKTSTGFYPAGGASVETVEIMATAGIRDARSALVMVRADATRLGLSSTTAVPAELDQPERPR